MIRSSSHTLKFSNTIKLENLSAFIDEYRRVSKLILDDVWDNGYIDNNIEFNVSKFKYKLPKYLDYNKFKFDTFLSARALSSLVTQLRGNIDAVCKKQSKRIFIFDKKSSEGIFDQKLWTIIESNQPTKPDVSRINPELSSKCSEFIETGNHFNGFLKLKSLGKSFGTIILPIKYHKHSNKFKSWKRLSSFRISKNTIDIRWERNTPDLKNDGRIVGADQGATTILTLSDGQTTDKLNIREEKLLDIMNKMSRARKGSKRFRKLQSYRKNLINECINKLDFDSIKQINLEDVINIGYKRRTSRKMSHWTNTLIRNKIKDICELNGVRFNLQSSPYRSQRCNVCGWVKDKNRKGKEFKCTSCSFYGDADLNAAKNHEISLPDVPFSFLGSGKNKIGFFWNPDTIFTEIGAEHGVPLVTTNKIVDDDLSNI